MGRRHSVAARDELRLLEQGSLILHSAVMRAVAAEPADSPFLSCLTLLAALKASARLCPSRKAGLGAGSRGRGRATKCSFFLPSGCRRSADRRNSLQGSSVPV